MISKQTVIEALSEIISDMKDSRVILTAETKFADIEEWDSLLQMTLLVVVEQKYGIQIPIRQIVQSETVQELAEFICNEEGSK